ncbi:MAG: membrane dipeptidase [Haliea sp.]|uniref:dipeptidase n=1 Tax=Marinobacter salarius TaxID=1420917 RepID=UPI0032EF5088
MTADTAIVWDAHSCLPIATGIDFDMLRAHRAAGFHHVAINIAMDMTPLADVLKALAWFRHCAEQSPEYLIAGTVEDVERAAREGLLAITFDIEGANCLLEEPAMVQLYADLGVRMMHLAYNLDNAYGGGCHGPNTGLTALGREVVSAANRAGIVMDCSHSSVRTSLDVIAHSDRPVVFSHANVHALVGSTPRNITDEQIRACATTGGVVGVCGFNLFLGQFPSSAEHMAQHIDYVVQLVGIDHAGIGWDYAYPHSDVPLAASEEEYQKYFIDGVTSDAQISEQGEAYVPLDQRVEIGQSLRRRGYDQAAVDKVMGLNFYRVARACWTRGRS